MHETVVNLVEELAAHGVGAIRPSYVARHADVSIEAAHADLVALSEDGLLKTEFQAVCPDDECHRTVLVKTAINELPLNQTVRCPGGHDAIVSPQTLWVSFSPTDALFKRVNRRPRTPTDRKPQKNDDPGEKGRGDTVAAAPDVWNFYGTVGAVVKDSTETQVGDRAVSTGQDAAIVQGAGAASVRGGSGAGSAPGGNGGNKKPWYRTLWAGLLGICALLGGIASALAISGSLGSSAPKSSGASVQATTSSYPAPVTTRNGVVLYRVDTGTGGPASVRAQPNTGSRILARLPDESLVRILCTTQGQYIEAYLSKGTLWDYVQPKLRSLKGYVFDGLLSTEVSGPVAKPCA